MRISVELSTGELQTELINEQKVLIGRSRTCGFTVKEESISRQHCLIEDDCGSFYVTDLESANGVYIDNERIKSNDRVSVETHQDLRIGKIRCRLSSTEKPIYFEKKSQQIKNQSSVPEVKSRKKRILTSLPYLAVFCLAVLAVVFMGNDSTPSKNGSSLGSGPKEEYADVKDSFYSTDVYQQLFSKKSCGEFKAVCGELRLSAGIGEGVVERDREYFIFLERIRLKIPPSKEGSDPKELELIALYDLIFPTSFFQNFMEGKLAQVHLVLTEDQVPVRIVRFHNKNLGKVGNLKRGLRFAKKHQKLYFITQKAEGLFQVKNL